MSVSHGSVFVLRTILLERYVMTTGSAVSSLSYETVMASSGSTGMSSAYHVTLALSVDTSREGSGPCSSGSSMGWGARPV